MSTQKIIANEKINPQKVNQACQIIASLQQELKEMMTQGYGPFLAAVYDENGHLIAKEANTVVQTQCSHNHAEMNTIKKAQEVLKTYDLSPYNLSLYVTAEPCMMCLGGILWSGIKEVYYGVSSKCVEKLTGFDEGFKPQWLTEFKNRGITVYGNLETQAGEQVLKDYVTNGKKVYKPQR